MVRHLHPVRAAPAEGVGPLAEGVVLRQGETGEPPPRQAIASGLVCAKTFGGMNDQAGTNGPPLFVASPEVSSPFTPLA